MSYRGRGNGNYRGGFQRSHGGFGSDVSMDSTSNNGINNSNRVLGPGQQLNQLAQQSVEQNSVPIEVRGWQGGSKDDLLSFLSRKTRITLINSVVENDVIVGNVRSQSDADALVKWSGVRFAGNALRITKRQTGATSNTIDLLKRFLHKRYNAQAKLLDLTNIASDAELQSNGAFNTISTQSKLFPALMKLASNENLVVESVNLSENNLEDISGITTLSQTYPNLINLAISNNRISKLRSFEIWKNKFKHLRELILVNNPITTDINYKDEISKIFPKLIVLDGVVIRDEAKLKQIFGFPFTSKQFFFENPDLQQISTQFISNFLQLWDTDRSQLLQLYTQESQFSVSVDSSVPNDASAQNVSFGHYIPISRNLTRVSSEKTRQQRLSKGPEQISKLFNNIPKSKHKLTENPNLYSVECWRYEPVNGFIISLHGEYDEVANPQVDANNTNSSNSRNVRRGAISSSSSNRLTPKSFDRTFVIAPGPIIASDLLSVRPIANAEAWIEKPQDSAVQPTPIPSAPTISPSTPQQVPTQPPLAQQQLQLPPNINLSLEQNAIVEKLHLETKLNAQFTLLLAEQSGWNYENALQGFKQSHANGQIPPEAFQ